MKETEQLTAQLEAATRAALARRSAAQAELAQVEQDTRLAEAAHQAAVRAAAAREAAARDLEVQEAARRELKARLIPAPQPVELTNDSASQRRGQRNEQPRTRWGLIGVAGAFCAAAFVVYLVPRYFPEMVPASLRAPAVAAAPSGVVAPGGAAAPGTPGGLPPLYSPDPQARRDLVLSYELKAPPPEQR